MRQNKAVGRKTIAPSFPFPAVGGHLGEAITVAFSSRRDCGGTMASGPRGGGKRGESWKLDAHCRRQTATRTTHTHTHRHTHTHARTQTQTRTHAHTHPKGAGDSRLLCKKAGEGVCVRLWAEPPGVGHLADVVRVVLLLVVLLPPSVLHCRPHRLGRRPPRGVRVGRAGRHDSFLRVAQDGRGRRAKGREKRGGEQESGGEKAGQGRLRWARRRREKGRERERERERETKGEREMERAECLARPLRCAATHPLGCVSPAWLCLCPPLGSAAPALCLRVIRCTASVLMLDWTHTKNCCASPRPRVENSAKSPAARWRYTKTSRACREQLQLSTQGSSTSSRALE